MNRRTALGTASGASLVALAACGAGGMQDGSITPLRSGAPAGSQAQVAIAPIVLPSPEAPQPDGKLTLIWFHDFD